MRLIDADKLLEGIAELKQSPWFNNKYGYADRKEAVETIEYLCIQKEPTIDAVDLISREDAIDAVEKAKTAKSADGEIFCAKINAQMNIQHLPSVQTERKKGKWIVDKDCEGKTRYVTCNLCGHKEFNWNDPNFCPNCGADMRGEEK